MKCHHSEEGMTLIEVLISMGIIAIAALGGIAQYQNASEIKVITMHKKLALELANEQLEIFRGMGYSDSALNSNACPNFVQIVSDVCLGGEIDIGTGKCLNDKGLFCDDSDGLGKTVLVCHVGSGLAQYKQIQVDIDWKETGLNDKTFNVSLSTYKRQ